MKIKSLFAVSAVALASMSAQAATNLIVNGSFEENVLTPGTWDTFFKSEVDGWTTGKLGIELRNNVAGVAQAGANFAELDTTANSWMSQKVTIITPGSYQLSFWYNSRADVSSRSDAISWSFGEGNAGVVRPSVPANPKDIWHQFSQTFALSAGEVTLRFKARGASDSVGGSLDNVSVTAVPEPDSYALMLAGLGLMAAIARRRSKRKT
jgi:hypothetical protein